MKRLRISSLAAILILGSTALLPHTAASQEPLPNLVLNPLVFVNAGKDDQGNCLIRIRLNIANKAAGKAGAFSTGLEVGASQFVYAHPNGLPSASSTTISQAVVLAPGSYQVRAKTDVFDEVVETAEGDNSRTAKLVCAAEPR
jgi:hypothetical protein